MTGSLVQVQVLGQSTGLLPVLAGVPRGWGRARVDLASEFAGGEGCRLARPAGDPRYQTQLEREQCKVMGKLMGSEYHQRILP